MNNSQNKTSRISIDTKDHDEAVFSLRVFDEGLGFGDINDKVAEIGINDEMGKTNSVEDVAITEALEQLIENHREELVKLYNTKMWEIKNQDY